MVSETVSEMVSETKLIKLNERIDACYDSHVHWLATGQFAHRLSLQHLKKPEDVSQLQPEAHAWQGDWLIGYGWDQNHWPNAQFPHRRQIDAWIDNKPIVFIRVDGHAVWVNSLALNLINPQLLQTDPHGGKIVRDEHGEPTGVLIDTAKTLIDTILPKLTDRDVRQALLKGQQIFNHAGFTHIRDLSCSAQQWQEATRLDQTGLLTMAVEQFFDAEDPKDFTQTLELAKQARGNPTANLRPMGIKVYFDGALGSEGAYLSHPYLSGSGRGLQILSKEAFTEILHKTWENNFDLAVHVIGDQAGHDVIEYTCAVWQQGLRGRLHLEHAEILRPETIQLMKTIDVQCHLQPCHWLTDSHWLEEKIGSLNKYVFPWRALQEAEIPIDFGSDSPIEPPSVINNLRALELATEQGVPRLLGHPCTYHSHRDRAWAANSFTIFSQGQVAQLVFRGEHLL